MSLDPEIAALLDAQPRPSTTDMTPQAARALHEQIAEALQSLARPVARVENLEAPGPDRPVPLRLYYPVEEAGLPLLIFIHGGGWFGGNLDTHEVLCRELALGANCVVVAMDYRLAPEHKFPAGLQDCLAAVGYLLDHAAELGADPARIAISGDSAGGNLAARVAQLLRDHGPHAPMFQLLIYPGIDLRLAGCTFSEADASPGFGAAEIGWCITHYLTHAGEVLNPSVSPILEPNLAGLPPTFIVTAELDPLRNDAETYGQRLVEAGVDVRLRRYLGASHGFLSLPPTVGLTRQALADVTAALRRAFA